MRTLKLYRIKHVLGREIEIVAIAVSDALTYLQWDRDECQLIVEKDILAYVVSDRQKAPIALSEFHQNLLGPEQIEPLTT